MGFGNSGILFMESSENEGELHNKGEMMSLLGRSDFSTKELQSQEGALFLDGSIHSHNKSVWKHRVERASRSGALVLSAAIQVLPHPTSCPCIHIKRKKKKNSGSSSLFNNTYAALRSLKDPKVDLSCFFGPGEESFNED